MARILAILWLAAVGLALDAAPAKAQFRFPPDRVFDYYDNNPRDGELDENEIRRVFGPMRERLEGRDSISRDDFIKLSEEQQREADGQRDGGSGDSGNRTSTTKPGAKPRERVTLELASKYTEGDRDGDGQLGLYEWIQWKTRKAIPEFLALDRNHDGFLTPYELTVAEKANGGTAAGGNGNGGTSGSRPGGPSTAGAGSAPAGGPRPRLDEETDRVAREAFRNLAREDGKIDQEEWQRSQATRSRFEAAGAELKLPADLDAFLAAYPAEQSTGGSGGPGGGGGEPEVRDTTGEGRFRNRGFPRDGGGGEPEVRDSTGEGRFRNRGFPRDGQ
jgi:hypothetical protein